MKLFIYIIFFVIIHFLYKWTKLLFIAIFSGKDESVFSHLKISFWAMFFTNIIKFLIYNKIEFNLYSRSLITIINLLLIIISWYILPGLTGVINSMTIELIWSFFILFLLAYFCLNIKKDIDKIEF
ncbi:MAG: hypothetical protein N3A58_03670 [Spirochaetes bacterium]|nr:hypothetical protein [Spirochaetota bacterium]